MMSRATSAVILLAFLVVPAWTSERGFLKRSKGWVDPSSIEGVLKQVLGSANGVESKTLAAIEATLTPLFNSLPKISGGWNPRVSAVYMKLAVQRYFRQTNGWLVKGFDPNVNTSQVSDPNGTPTSILGSDTPGYVEKVIEKMLSHSGFTLHEIVIAVATVERLIKDEVVKDVETAFDLNSLDTTDQISESSVSKVLSSYYIIEHLEGNSTDRAKHAVERKSTEAYYPNWPHIMAVIDDLVHNDAYQHQGSQNPFAVRTFSFEDVVRMTQLLNHVFGPSSNEECHALKERFSMLDVQGTGRVKLADFYKATPEFAWQFLESEEWLSSVGSLDTSDKSLGPQVIISNYVSKSCLSPSMYFDVCCLNECDGIFQHLEAVVKKPLASAAEITQAIEGGIAYSPVFSSIVPLEPRNLTANLRGWLSDIAQYHDDAIPLHGRLLAQWLHYVFPRECPFPHVSGTVQASSAMPSSSKGVAIDKVHELLASDSAKLMPSPEAGLNMWSLEEELLEPFHKHYEFPQMRTIVAFTMLCSLGSIVIKELVRAAGHFALGPEKMVSIHEHYV